MHIFSFSMSDVMELHITVILLLISKIFSQLVFVCFIRNVPQIRYSFKSTLKKVILMSCSFLTEKLSLNLLKVQLKE